jgi:guanine deaminase
MPVKNLRGKTVLGTFFEAAGPEAVSCFKDALITIDDSGIILSVVQPSSSEYNERLSQDRLSGKLVELGGYVLPGFVDLHVHAPQFPQLGKALDEPLERWLQKYTFPLESQYESLSFAASRYEALVDDLLANGTTTALYFATVHVESSALLADICLAKRQRALVGKVVMDNTEECPPSYRDASVAAGLAGTRQVIEHIQTLSGNDRMVQPVLTPRFTPSCTDPMLTALGALAIETGLHVQTHCSESDWHHDYALRRFGCSDVEALDRFQLLGRRTVLAHGNHLTPADMEIVVERGSSVAHCPYSNFYFSGAVFPLREALRKGMRVGLGTDIAGGPSASMFDAVRMALVAARALESGVEPKLPRTSRGREHSRIDMRTAFYLATAAGGDALDLTVGRLAQGYFFDAIQIDPEAPSGTIRLWNETDDELVLQTILLTASRANIKTVWTGGMQVQGNVSAAQ